MRDWSNTDRSKRDVHTAQVLEELLSDGDFMKNTNDFSRIREAIKSVAKGNSITEQTVEAQCKGSLSTIEEFYEKTTEFVSNPDAHNNIDDFYKGKIEYIEDLLNF